jgi:hypothetical protein
MRRVYGLAMERERLQWRAPALFRGSRRVLTEIATGHCKRGLALTEQLSTCAMRLTSVPGEV